jgi:hypothetical protein
LTHLKGAKNMTGLMLSMIIFGSPLLVAFLLFAYLIYDMNKSAKAEGKTLF